MLMLRQALYPGEPRESFNDVGSVCTHLVPNHGTTTGAETRRYRSRKEMIQIMKTFREVDLGSKLCSSNMPIANFAPWPVANRASCMLYIRDAPSAPVHELCSGVQFDAVLTRLYKKITALIEAHLNIARYIVRSSANRTRQLKDDVMTASHQP
jgi:hypothetical protein